VAEVLQDNPHRRVVRVGETVRRPPHPWSPTIHALLRHLESVGFPFSPLPRHRRRGPRGADLHRRRLGPGRLGPGGRRERPGRHGRAAARLSRGGRRLPPHRGLGRPRRPARPRRDRLPRRLRPWNLVWRASRPVGILDWDYAWPRPPLHDVAYALEYVVPFRDDATCLRWLRYPTPPARRRRLQLFAQAYAVSPAGLVDEVIAQQEAVLNRTRLLAATGHQPQADWLAAGTVNDDNLRWSRTHRHLFEEA
jgi:hypothetical protein